MIQQIDMVVLDVSGSMKSAAFHGDIMTRIEAAQAFFRTYIDKYYSHEVAAVIGLVLFGEKIDLTFPINRAFESFSTELGNLVANQSKTRLYEAILFATQTINSFKKTCTELSPKCLCRVLCLTDGQDNSGMDPYITYQYLKQSNVIVDSVAIGKEDHSKLSRLTRATGGSCFTVHNIQAGMELFEREAVVSLAVRQDFSPFSFNIQSKSDLDAIGGEVFAKNEVQIKTDTKIQNKAVNVTQIDVGKVINSTNNSGSSIARRILKEFNDFGSDPNFIIYIDESDVSYWKVIMQGETGTPYQGGFFMITYQFPSEYPFKPPNVRFATPIFHCNINNDGKLCLDILKDQWSPALTVRTVLFSIFSLLRDPNANDPLDTMKAAMFMDNRTLYMEKAIECTQIHAAKSIDELKATFNLS